MTIGSLVRIMAAWAVIGSGLFAGGCATMYVDNGLQR
jgi:hypothetical protein